MGFDRPEETRLAPYIIKSETPDLKADSIRVGFPICDQGAPFPAAPSPGTLFWLPSFPSWITYTLSMCTISATRFEHPNRILCLSALRPWIWDLGLMRASKQKSDYMRGPRVPHKCGPSPLLPDRSLITSHQGEFPRRACSALLE